MCSAYNLRLINNTITVIALLYASTTTSPSIFCLFVFRILWRRFVRFWLKWYAGLPARFAEIDNVLKHGFCSYTVPCWRNLMQTFRRFYVQLFHHRRHLEYLQVKTFLHLRFCIVNFFLDYSILLCVAMVVIFTIIFTVRNSSLSFHFLLF